MLVARPPTVAALPLRVIRTSIHHSASTASSMMMPSACASASLGGKSRLSRNTIRVVRTSILAVVAMTLGIE